MNEGKYSFDPAGYMIQPDGGDLNFNDAAKLLNSQAEQIERLEALRDVVSDVISDHFTVANGSHIAILGPVYRELERRYKACTPKTKADLLDDLLESSGRLHDMIDRINKSGVESRPVVEAELCVYNAAKTAYEAAEPGQ